MASLNTGKSSKKNGGDDLEHQNRKDEDNHLRSLIAEEIGKAMTGIMATLKRLEPSVQKQNSISELRSNTHKTKKDFKRKHDDISCNDIKKGKTGWNHHQSKPNKVKPKCKTCGKKHFGKCLHERTKGCGICKQTNHKSHECKDLKDATCYKCGEKGHIKTRCPLEATDRKNKGH